MTTPTFLLACLWVVAAALVAMLPMRWQFVPGLALLLGAPVLIWRLAVEYGWPAALLAVLAVVSMFRRPLQYYARRALGRGTEASE
ncbi:DUF2484 family protein [Roseovarius sp.]|uniref:DUF2484 family protein n=1 Tax=Roseovarius sp. TaxID=1486281 RepID=UPI0026238519|nr:DUF2484 family protein [Roseovarius sp.]MDM8166584.1 DUF2484 family protein [Roseovarius sp.]